MGAKISKAVGRRRNDAVSAHDRATSNCDHIGTTQATLLQSASTTHSPTADVAVNASASLPTEQPIASPIQQGIAMDGNDALSRATESVAVVAAPARPPTPPPAPTEQPDSVATPMAPPKKREPQCIICTEELSGEKPAGPVIRPCRLCDSDYCKSCVKDMFIKACKQTSRMPPKCCNILQLHVALPMLSPDEAKEYRAKYEEWSTPNPMYCPVPTCSAFISNRLLPATPSEKKKKPKDRVDSVVGTPKEVHVSCPECVQEACVKCRQPAHPGAPCQPLDFGVDKETAAALKRWGYKRCPKCGNGVRRMMGCNHMQCLCGAHFCWHCLVSMSECDGNCYEQENETNDMDADEVEVLERQRLSQAALEGADTSVPLVPLVVVGTANGRNMNLDIASNDYWEAHGTNFGTEPAEEPPDRAWQCEHHFDTAKIDYEQRLKDVYQVTGMECSRCWCTIYPEITLPKKMANPGGVRMVGGYSRPDASRTRSRDRGSRRGYMPGRAHTPLGRETRRQLLDLYSHLDLGIGDQAAANTSASGNSPASPQVIVDEYGDVIMADSESYTAQRSMSIPGGPGSASLYSTPTTSPTPVQLSTSAPQKTNAFPTEFTFRSEIAYPPFSFAHECGYCGIILCNTCKDAIQKEAEKKAEAESAAEAAEEIERAESTNASNLEPRDESDLTQVQVTTSEPTETILLLPNLEELASLNRSTTPDGSPIAAEQPAAIIAHS